MPFNNGFRNGGFTSKNSLGSQNNDATNQPAPDTNLITGTGGSDTLKGTSARNTITGQAGNDTLLGYGGNDSLLGGSGNDSLTGGSGHDTLTGGAGHDTLQGNDGHESLTGGAGQDSLYGLAGNDALFGDDGDDLLVGGEGDNTLNGAAGSDTLFSGAGDESLSAGLGNDRYEVDEFSGIDQLEDAGGEADILDFNAADFNHTGLSNDGDDLVIAFVVLEGSGTLTIKNYFDDGPLGSPGSGCVETILFNNGNPFDFDDFQGFFGG